jgi:glycogen debranching enzyme
VDAVPETIRPAPETRSPLEWSGEDLDSAEVRSALEWLETDGLGGFACGTAGGPSVRRYHGWYAPPSHSHDPRSPLIAECEELVWGAGEAAEISGKEETAIGKSAGGLVRFALEPFPTWRFETKGFSIERSFCLVRGRSIAITRYVNRGFGSVELRARPLLRVCELPPSPWHRGSIEIRGDAAWIGSLGSPARLYVRGAGARSVEESRSGPAARRSREEGDEAWGPVAWTWSLAAGEEAHLLFSCEEVSTDPAQLFETERKRRAFRPTEDPLFDELASRAEVFLLDGDRLGGSIVSGYPEPEWRGRDSMVSLPGLTLATARYAGAARVVNAEAARLSAGIHAPALEPEARSSDGPLWFVLAVEWFTRLRRDPSRPTPLLGAVRSVLASYREGERPGVSVGSDELVSGILPGQPLTWMNAMAGEEPVTPRYGRAVEVNALWHAALKAAARLERLAEESTRARDFESQAWHVARRFNEVFWSADDERLYDVVGPDGSDSSLRPNQIFAVSLSEDLLPPHRARPVYWAVRNRLLTPFGLRTLDPADPRYRGRGAAAPAENALMLHQGAAWPWLLGAFADAHFRVLGQSSETRTILGKWLKRLRSHVREAGMGSISEVFDGDEPHTPRGSFAEARNVGEIARIFSTYLNRGQ